MPAVVESLPEPEADWDAPGFPDVDLRAEVERRLGACDAPPELLGGGRQNLHVRVGDRVLRIYRKGAAAATKEAALLARRWDHFAVPEVMEQGHDFLVLRHVAHERVPATAEHGAAVGRALAELHAIGFERAGVLDGALQVAAPLPGLDRLAALGVRVAELAARLGPPVLLHGDFRSGNLRWVSGRLLIFDWEEALAGPALFDLGTLIRWWPPPAFVDAFAASYGGLPADWRRLADTLDLVNLAGKRAAPGSRRALDLARRISVTLAEHR